MNKEFSLSRPTFKRTLRRISIISVLLTMTLIWLLICVASVLTLKQYAQKNLDLTAATMTHSLEAALVFSDNAAAAETLATLGRQGQFSAAEVRDKNGRIIASWRYDARAADDKLIGLISHWLFPLPVSQPVWHNGRGHRRSAACRPRQSYWSFYLAIAGSADRMYSAGIRHCPCCLRVICTMASWMRCKILLKWYTTFALTEIFSRRVPDERIAEFHLFAQDFNSLLDEMEEWQLRLQAKNAQLLRTALHDPLTGLANRAAFRSCINALMKDNSARSSSALLFLDGDNFKYINDTWGHAAGDRVLIEVAKRLAEFGGSRYQTYRLGGDEFAMVLYGVHSEYEVQRICAALSQAFNRPFELHNGQRITMTLSIGFALTWEHATAEKTTRTGRSKYVSG